MSRITMVYDKRQGKVVPEHERTDRGEAKRGKGPFVPQRFSEVRSKQLAKNIFQYKSGHPDCTYSSYRELESKARARGFAIDNDRSQDID